jgi:hypothetical protein
MLRRWLPFRLSVVPARVLATPMRRTACRRTAALYRRDRMAFFAGFFGGFFAAFFGTAFFAGAFLAGDFFAGDFFAGDFFAGVFFAGDFFAGDFFAGVFFAGDFFAAFFAGVVPAALFSGFFASSLAGDFFKASAAEPIAVLTAPATSSAIARPYPTFSAAFSTNVLFVIFGPPGPSRSYAVTNLRPRRILGHSACC